MYEIYDYHETLYITNNKNNYRIEIIPIWVHLYIYKEMPFSHFFIRCTL